MADYDSAYGYADSNMQNVNFSAISPPFPPPPPIEDTPANVIPANTYHGSVDIDTATIVSIASSCIILISGCIAVVCLIMYMKKTDMLYRSRTCAKCGAHVIRDQHENLNVLHSRAAAVAAAIRNENGIIIDGASSAISHSRMLHQSSAMVEGQQQLQQQHQQQQNANKCLTSIAIFRSFGELHMAPNEVDANDSFPFGDIIETSDQQQRRTLTSTEAAATTSGPESLVTITNASHTNEFRSKTSSDEYDNEPTPYATFNLPGFDKDDSKIDGTYETFTAKFGEPPYMLLKKGFDPGATTLARPPPLYTESMDANYKLRQLIENCGPATGTEDHLYQSTGLSQCQSIASCSSNHDELIRAYEYGNQQKLRLLKLEDEFIEILENEDKEADDSNETCYRSLASDRESPTDPGIRKFTKSPPKPNEKRQGVVFHHLPTDSEMIEISTKLNNAGGPNNGEDDELALKPQRIGTGILSSQSRNNNVNVNKTIDLSPNETSNSFSSIPGSSSDANSSSNNNSSSSNSSSNGNNAGSSNNSTPSVGSDSANTEEEEESSSSTATPSEPPAGADRITANFGAIPRDRSRNPSWASFSTMKSNLVLTPQCSGSLVEDRAFSTKSNQSIPIKEGLSSDDENEYDENDVQYRNNNTQFDHKPSDTGPSRHQELLEDIYELSRTSFGSFASNDDSTKRAANANRRSIDK